MAKSTEKMMAREMIRKGESIREIAKKVDGAIDRLRKMYYLMIQ